MYRPVVQGYGIRSARARASVVLARPDRTDLRDRLNLVLKKQVWYQPFCPSMLETGAGRLLADFGSLSDRHMTMAFVVRPCFREAFSGDER